MDHYLKKTFDWNNSLIASGFLPAWKQIVANEQSEQFYKWLEDTLYVYARNRGELVLSVPMVYFECCRP